MFASFLAATALFQWPIAKMQLTLGAVWVGVATLSIALASKRLLALGAAIGAIAVRAFIGFILTHSLAVGAIAIVAGLLFIAVCRRDLRSEYDSEFLRTLSDKSLSATIIDLFLIAAAFAVILLVKVFLSKAF